MERRKGWNQVSKPDKSPITLRLSRSRSRSKNSASESASERKKGVGHFLSFDFPCLLPIRAQPCLPLNLNLFAPSRGKKNQGVGRSLPFDLLITHHPSLLLRASSAVVQGSRAHLIRMGNFRTPERACNVSGQFEILTSRSPLR